MYTYLLCFTVNNWVEKRQIKLKVRNEKNYKSDKFWSTQASREKIISVQSLRLEVKRRPKLADLYFGICLLTQEKIRLVDEWLSRQGCVFGTSQRLLTGDRSDNNNKNNNKNCLWPNKKSRRDLKERKTRVSGFTSGVWCETRFGLCGCESEFANYLVGREKKSKGKEVSIKRFLSFWDFLIWKEFEALPLFCNLHDLSCTRPCWRNTNGLKTGKLLKKLRHIVISAHCKTGFELDASWECFGCERDVLERLKVGFRLIFGRLSIGFAFKNKFFCYLLFWKRVKQL